MKVWKIRIGCLTDEKLRDRMFSNGKRYVMPYRLPERDVYFVATPNNRNDLAEDIAIQMAMADGIELPVCIGSEWVEALLSAGR